MNVVWPDNVQRLFAAIKSAEGSNPDWNNPLDMTISLGLPNAGPQNQDGVLKFLNLADGVYVGCHQCWLMLTGKSEIYKLTDTLEVVGMKYSNGDPNWAKNVADFLGVSITTTLGEIAAAG